MKSELRVNEGMTLVTSHIQMFCKSSYMYLYALMGVETAEVIIFNGFRFKPIIIP